MKVSPLYFVLLIAAAELFAAPPDTAPARIEPADRARDAATQNLIDQILTQPTLSRRRLSTELATNPAADRSLREFISGAAKVEREATDSESGRTSCQARLATPRLNQFIAELAARDPYMLDVRRLQLPATAVLEVEGYVDEDRQPFDDHPGWRHCTPSQVALARRAAAQDLRQNLLVELRGLRATANSSLGETALAEPAARKAIEMAVEKTATPEVALDPCGVAHLRLVLPRRDVVALLRGALKDIELKNAVDWTRLSETMPLNVTVEGFSVAPASPADPTASRPAE